MDALTHRDVCTPFLQGSRQQARYAAVETGRPVDYEALRASTLERKEIDNG